MGNPSEKFQNSFTHDNSDKKTSNWTEGFPSSSSWILHVLLECLTPILIIWIFPGGYLTFSRRRNWLVQWNWGTCGCRGTRPDWDRTLQPNCCSSFYSGRYGRSPERKFLLALRSVSMIGVVQYPARGICGRFVGDLCTPRYQRILG